MDIDDLECVAYDEPTEMPGGREALRRELDTALAEFTQRGGQVQVVPLGATGQVDGYWSVAMSQCVAERNQRVAAQAVRRNDDLARRVGELLAVGGVMSPTAIAAKLRTTKERVRKVLRTVHGDNPLAQQWLRDGRANGNSKRSQHSAAQQLILDHLRGMAERGDVAPVSAIAAATGSTCQRVRALIRYQFAAEPIAAQWLVDGRKNGKSAAARKGQPRVRYPGDV